MNNNTCNCKGACANPHVGMFILRVVTGVILAHAGWEKLQNLAMTQNSFAALHFPAFMAVAVTWVELVGGIALVLGIFTCLTSAVLAIVMAVAVLVAWKSGGFVGAEFALLVLASLLALKHGGRGKWGMGKHCGCFICKNKESGV